MARTLNPQLFGLTETPIIKVDGAPLREKQMGEIEAQIETINQKLDRWAHVMEQKIQKLSAVQKALGDQIQLLAESTAKHNATIYSKLNERRAAEAKTQELFDRHNQLVNSFEGRIHQVQKVATEQEIKLMNYQSTYDEVLREIRNLKKMN